MMGSESGVKTIRTGLVDYNLDFIIEAYQRSTFRP